MKQEKPKPGLVCAVCKGTIRNPDNRADTIYPVYKDGEHANLKDCIKELVEQIACLNEDLTDLEHKLEQNINLTNRIA